MAFIMHLFSSLFLQLTFQPLGKLLRIYACEPFKDVAHIKACAEIQNQMPRSFCLGSLTNTQYASKKNESHQFKTESMSKKDFVNSTQGSALKMQQQVGCKTECNMRKNAFSGILLYSHKKGAFYISQHFFITSKYFRIIYLRLAIFRIIDLA